MTDKSEMPVAALEAELLRKIAATGETTVKMDALSLALAARCLEEVRVWVENFCRAQALTAEENGLQFRLRRIRV